MTQKPYKAHSNTKKKTCSKLWDTCQKR